MYFNFCQGGMRKPNIGSRGGRPPSYSTLSSLGAGDWRLKDNPDQNTRKSELVDDSRVLNNTSITNAFNRIREESFEEQKKLGDSLDHSHNESHDSTEDSFDTLIKKENVLRLSVDVRSDGERVVKKESDAENFSDLRDFINSRSSRGRGMGRGGKTSESAKQTKIVSVILWFY